jgi:superfamily II DNA or RNA helicase
MVLALKSRKAFLDRERRDFREYKKLTREQLEQRMLKLPAKPPIWYKLTHLQRVCFIIGAETGRFAYWNDTGTGKSLLTIALVRYFRRLGVLKHALFLVPRKINKHEWMMEMQKHSPNSSCLVLQGSSEEKWRQLSESDALFVFETYAGLFKMACDKKETRKGPKLSPNKKKVAQLAKHFGGFVCDESVNVGNHTKLPFRICRKLAQTSKVVFTMTGTPFNRDPALMWAQMFLVDSGYTLGETLGLFRSIFCNEVENYFTGFKEHQFDKKKTNLLHDLIAHNSISYPVDEGSLPARVDVSKYITMTEDAQAYYDRFRQELIAAKGNFMETKNAFLRLRQISSGFVGYQDDETGERAKFEFPENPKLDMLMSILSSLDPAHKAIVFVDFNYSGERILKELKAEKIDASLLYGKTKDQEKVRDQFVNDPKKWVLILQNKLGTGLNIQVARYGIYFESPVSAIDRKQTQRRVERQHSLYKTIFIYDLIVQDTVDEKILQFHKEGGDLFESIIRDKVQI